MSVVVNTCHEESRMLKPFAKKPFEDHQKVDPTWALMMKPIVAQDPE